MTVCTATGLCAAAKINISNFLSKLDIENFWADVHWDDELRAIDVAIILRDQGMPHKAIEVLSIIDSVFPRSFLVQHQSAVCAARVLDFSKAEQFAFRALEYGGNSADILVTAACSAAMNRNFEDARRIIGAAGRLNYAEKSYINDTVQFIEYCANWDYRDVINTIIKLQEDEKFIDVNSVKNNILVAVSEKKPFSFVRLGDGEGSWLTINSRDEGLFSSVYRSNRRSFLFDWFGSDRLIDDDAFNAFARGLAETFASHDIIGIPPVARIEQEASFMSVRGLTSSINIFRFLETAIPDFLNVNKVCSSSVNLDLMYSGLFKELNKVSDEICLITSQTSLPPIFTRAGLAIRDLFYVPGDSRNFMHLPGHQGPVCQYPDYVEQINGLLASADQTGKVYLVGAGFVGKKYIETIKLRGGIALDIGSVADHIVKNPDYVFGP